MSLDKEIIKNIESIGLKRGWNKEVIIEIKEACGIVEEKKTLSDKVILGCDQYHQVDVKEANIKFIDWVDELRKSYRLTAEAPKGEMIRQKAKEIWGDTLC